MKNVHILPTDKPSRLGYLTKKGKEVYKDLRLFDRFMPNILDSENQNIYITNDEEIKVGDWVYSKRGFIGKFGEFENSYFNECQKIILTTDIRLAPDVQKIDDEFLEWFVKNPSCEEVEITKVADLDLYYKNGIGGQKYKIIIPKEEQENDYTSLLKPVGTRQETTLEEVAGIWVNNRFTKQIKDEDIYASKSSIIESHILFAKWQQERSYSEEEALNLLTHFAVEIQRQNKKGQYPIEIKGWFERNKETFKKK